MEIKENVHVIVFNPKETKDISCPVYFVLDNLLEEAFDTYDSLLCRAVKYLGNVIILLSRTFGWELLFHVCELVNCSVINLGTFQNMSCQFRICESSDLVLFTDVINQVVVLFELFFNLKLEILDLLEVFV